MVAARFADPIVSLQPYQFARDRTGSGTIAGTMAFDRKEYGMNSGIPFIKIADRVEVGVNLKATRVSGPPVAFE